MLARLRCRGFTLQQNSTHLWGRLGTSADLLPRRCRIGKVTERLGELKWLVDDALLLLVVADFRVSSEGEVFSQGVALETVVGQDAAADISKSRR